MNCEYFGQCGSCTLYNMEYEKQLTLKIDEQKEHFKDLYCDSFEVISSQEKNFRSRVEFKIYHEDGNIDYAMRGQDKRFVSITSCQIVDTKIYNLMPKLLKYLQQNSVLKEKLFSIEFMTTLDEILVTLIYHKKLDDKWIKIALGLQENFGIFVIGRSRGQKFILKQDFITNKITISNKNFFLLQKEGIFTQPNYSVNHKMIQWVLSHVKSGKDLCELYCGGGNFTIPLSIKFDKVLATEISKSSICSAQISSKLSDRNNIKFVRMGSEEIVEALNRQRTFKRLQNIDINDYDFSTIFIDPPRSGVDSQILEFIKQFDQIIYISCNPVTLKRDINILIKTHKIINFVFFDQFPWTNHLECGVILNK